MTEGDIVLAAIPHADGSTKTRPALVLREMPPFRDLLVCGISTQLHHEVTGFDERIGHGDSDFAGSGLNAESLIRLGYLAVIPRGKIIGSIGAVASSRRIRLLQALSEYLTR